jgi:hypothetical protein
MFGKSKIMVISQVGRPLAITISKYYLNVQAMFFHYTPFTFYCISYRKVL